MRFPLDDIRRLDRGPIRARVNVTLLRAVLHARLLEPMSQGDEPTFRPSAYLLAMTQP